MSGLIERTYILLGQRYLRAFVLAYLVSSAALCLLANAVFTLFVPTDMWRFLLTLAVSEVLLLGAMLHGSRAWLRVVAPITTWLAASRPADGADAAWRAAIIAPGQGVRMQAWRSVLFTATPLTAFIALEYDLPAVTVLLFAIGLLGAATYPTLLVYLLTEQVLRPVVVDAARAGSLTEPSPRGVSLRAKLLLAIPLVGVITSGFTNVVVTARNHGDIADLGVSMLVGIGVTATAGLLLTALLARSIGSPLEELLDTTRRVADGDLDARAPVLGGDEIGRLATSFNMMIEAVAEREALSERALRAEAEAERAVGAERARIARELHDSISHSMTMVVLQASAGQVTLDDQPERTRTALVQMEDAGRTALGELRRFLGILRAPGEGAALAPAPRLRELAEICEHLARTGVHVDVDLPSSVDDWPPDLELAAFRISQEALTNVLKHAGAACVRVSITEQNEAVQIEIVDDGCGATNGTGGPGGGHGLAGMRERAAVYGGRVQTGPGPGGSGFAVRASLPLAVPVGPGS